MRVNPTDPSLTLTPTRTAPAERATSGSSSAPAGAAASDSSQFIPTSDLSRLLVAARAAPEVRADAVRDAVTKLATGELDTAAAAADAARAFREDIG